MSRPTMIGPVSEKRVFTGYWLIVFRISLIGRFRSIFTALSVWLCLYFSRKRLGLCSSCSTNSPSSVIFAQHCRSAEHDTPMPTRHDAPCLRLSLLARSYRGIRITRTS